MRSLSISPSRSAPGPNTLSINLPAAGDKPRALAIVTAVVGSSVTLTAQLPRRANHSMIGGRYVDAIADPAAPSRIARTDFIPSLIIPTFGLGERSCISSEAKSDSTSSRTEGGNFSVCNASRNEATSACNASRSASCIRGTLALLGNQQRSGHRRDRGRASYLAPTLKRSNDCCLEFPRKDRSRIAIDGRAVPQALSLMLPAGQNGPPPLLSIIM